jgi:hypothetical protein
MKDKMSKDWMQSVNVALATCVSLACLSLLAHGCSGPSAPDDEDLATQLSFSFEEGLGGWTGEPPEEAFDGTPCDGRIERSNDRSHTGSWSVNLFLNNNCDAGRVWIERSFSLEPNTPYGVRIRYWFATADWGTLNLWNIVGGAQPEPFEVLNLVTLSDTGNGRDNDVGFVWFKKEHVFEVTTNSNGAAFLALGVWGTFEVTREYFIDDVSVTAEQM